ncbi:MAG TPA: S-layer homology domain-containing protein [Syntrophomonadaceae bacterium]|nr:S-layer homology domain-containing protein [Syntrophomonadaceae bacterium]HPR94005.1 S-layer homology domain-containing protein [Syntrophomonadaceae bacterium]
MKVKKLLRILSVLILGLVLLPSPALAEDTTNWATLVGFESGQTYYIASTEDLQRLTELVDSGNSGEDATFVLTDNIDLSTVCSELLDENWTPIGNSGNPFAGTFDGGGNTVNNLYIDSAASDYQGLFGFISGGSVINLKVSGEITGNSYVGGITGYMENGVIADCENTLTAYANFRYAGGIAGYMQDSDISDCSNSGHVHIVPAGEYEAGGIVGCAMLTINAGADKVIISGCSNSGNVCCGSTDNDECTGGIVGCAKGYSDVSGEQVYHLIIENCLNSGPVINAEDGTGGIVGYLETGIVRECSNSGSVTGVNGVGGIAGYVYFDSTVSNCTNTGAVTASEQYSGGIAGCVYALYDYADIVIENCINEGNVTCTYSSELQGGYDCTEGTYDGLEEGQSYYNDPTGGCAGGVVGTLWLSAFTNTPEYNGGSVSVKDCTNSGAVTNEASTTSGGIVGYVFNGSVDADCGNTGTIHGMVDDTSVGPAIGHLFLTNNLVNISGISSDINVGGTDSGTTDILFGGSYMITLTPNSGCVLRNVVVKMGGVDVTDSTYHKKTVQIDKVTGNIVITATVRYSSDTTDSTDTTYTTNYPITVIQGENGSITISPKRSPAGSKVTITTAPDKDFAVFKVVVTDKNDNVIDVIDNGGGNYSFIMPASGVWVAVTFQELPACDGGASCPAHGYTDVDTSQWYHEYVDYVIRNGLMSGYSFTIFGVNGNMTREQFVTVLYRTAGEPTVSGVCSFTDAETGSYYYNALVWAEQNKIIGGYGNGTFGLGDSVTREQLAVTLYNYAKHKGYDVSIGEDTNILSYNDALTISEYAFAALQWACGVGILTGDGYDNMNPRGSAIRAEVAAMLQRFIENVTV